MITQTETTNPALADYAGMIVILVLALTIVILLTRAASDPACDYEVTPVLNEVER